VWTFLDASSKVFRNPTQATGTAGPLLARLRNAAPCPLPADRELVRANAATQVLAAAMIAAHVLPRSAAVVLVGSMVPTTLAAHSFWAMNDPAARRTHQQQFSKNLAMIGGLVLLATGPDGQCHDR
jgi:uncharacterized membrane protein YphA (DoxX/SURF4 family)